MRLVLILAWLLLAEPVWAQTPPMDSGAAEALAVQTWGLAGRIGILPIPIAVTSTGPPNPDPLVPPPTTLTVAWTNRFCVGVQDLIPALIPNPVAPLPNPMAGQPVVQVPGGWPLLTWKGCGIAWGEAFTAAGVLIALPPPPPPTPVFTYNPSAPVTGIPVTFTAAASTCQTPCAYTWTDDYDGFLYGTGPTLTFTFKSVGMKLMRLTLTDAQARTASVEHDVAVSGNVPLPPPPPPPGATFYVAPTGNDTNSGSPLSPWKTVQKAANTLTAGQTVSVAAGTYNERISVSRSGSLGNLIVFQGQGTVKTLGFSISGSYLKIDGFEMAVSTPGGWSDRAGGSSIYLSGSNNTISNNYIHNSTAAGIYFTSTANNNTVVANRLAYAVECQIYINGNNNRIESNDISHTRSIGGSDADGIRFFGSNNAVRKNTIHDITLSDSPGESPHIDAFQSWGPASNYVFEQNWIDKSADGHHQGFTMGALPGYGAISNITIRNNVFISRGSGYQVNINTGDSGVVTNTVIVNNDFIALNGSAGRGVWLFSLQRGAVVKNNVFYDYGDPSQGSGEPYILIESGATGADIANNALFIFSGATPAGGCRAGDLCYLTRGTSPGFVNLTGLDFHLTSGSILMNKGVTLPAVPNDYDGKTRTAPIDIGAFEFQ